MKRASGIRREIIIDAANHVAKRYVDGRCFAVRFAQDMSEQAIEASIKRDPIDSREWHAYNESTNTFI